MAWRCRCTLLLDSPVRSAKLRMLCWPYSRIALKMTILLAHNPMGSVRALKGGCNWKNQLFRVRDRPPVVPLYVDAPVAKKTHTVKNIVLGGLHTHTVNYLSQTYEGRRHDKKLIDEENPTYPTDIGLYKDTGFQGYEPEAVKTFQPQKKPKGKELTAEQKEQNSLISSSRIVIKNIIAGIKRCRIVKDLFRNTKDRYDDLVMEIACALHNFRVDCRQS